MYMHVLLVCVYACVCDSVFVYVGVCYVYVCMHICACMCVHSRAGQTALPGSV